MIPILDRSSGRIAFNSKFYHVPSRDRPVVVIRRLWQTHKELEHGRVVGSPKAGPALHVSKLRYKDVEAHGHLHWIPTTGSPREVLVTYMIGIVVVNLRKSRSSTTRIVADGNIMQYLGVSV